MSHPLRGQPAPVPPRQPVHRNTNHVLHLLLSIITFGMWLLVWPCVAAYNHWRNDQEQRQYQADYAHYHQARTEWDQAQQ